MALLLLFYTILKIILLLHFEERLVQDRYLFIICIIVIFISLYSCFLIYLLESVHMSYLLFTVLKWHILLVLHVNNSQVKTFSHSKQKVLNLCTFLTCYLLFLLPSFTSCKNLTFFSCYLLFTYLPFVHSKLKPKSKRSLSDLIP